MEGQKTIYRSQNWVNAFKKLTWALLDAHWDVLTDLNIHLEDLYSWSFRSLREWILSKLMELEANRRRLLLERWMNKTEKHHD